MSTYQCLYWPPKSAKEAIKTLERFKSSAERFDYQSSGSCEYDLLFDSKDSLSKQELPNLLITANLTSITNDVTTENFEQAIKAVQGYLQAGATGPDNAMGSVSLEFGWSDHGSNYFDSIGHFKSYKVLWCMHDHRSVKRPVCRLALDPGNRSNLNFETYIQAMEKHLAPLDFKLQSRTKRRVNLDVSFYHPKGGWVDWHDLIFGREQGPSKKFTYNENHDGSWNGPSGGIFVEISEDEAFELTKKAYQVTNAKSQKDTNSYIKLSSSGGVAHYSNDNCSSYINAILPPTPERWKFYRFEGEYLIKDLYDLKFTREALAKQNIHSYRYKPYDQIFLGGFNHTNDDDPHPDLRTRGEVVAIVTENEIGLILNLKMGPLPKKLAKAFGDNLIEIEVGEIPGFKKGERKGKKSNKPTRKR